MGKQEDADKAWAASLSPKDRRAYVKVSMDEVEVARIALKKQGKNLTPAALKTTRIWVERHRRLLKFLGHKKAIVFKYPKARKTENECQETIANQP